MASDGKESSLFPIQQHGSHTAALLTTAGFTTYRPPESTNAGGDRRLKAEQLEGDAQEPPLPLKAVLKGWHVRPGSFPRHM